MEQHQHILPLRLYLIIGLILLLLTALTVSIASLDFGSWNLVIALVIAGLKASLVGLFFMHLKYDNKIYAAVFVLAVVFLVMFIVFAMFDTTQRGGLNLSEASSIHEYAVIYDSTGQPLSHEARILLLGSPREEFTL